MAKDMPAHEHEAEYQRSVEAARPAGLQWGKIIATCPIGHEALFMTTNKKTADHLVKFWKEEDASGAVLRCRQCNDTEYLRTSYGFRFEPTKGEMHP